MPHRPADRQHRGLRARPRACSRCRSGCRASCTSAATGWRAATSAGPTLTAERFVPDSVRGEPGARLYRTGDLVRWRPDGDARVPGPRRPPGEDPRLPHRAGRDRGGAARRHRRSASAVAVVVREDAAGRPAAGGLRGAPAGDRGRRRETCAPSSASGCRSTWCPSGLRVARGAAADAQRQGGPAGAAGAAAGRAGPARGLRRAAHAGRGAAGRASGPRCWASSGSAATTTSSTSAATRCWPPAGVARRASASASSCRCARCSRRRRSPAWRRGRRRRSGGGAAGSLAPRSRCPATGTCRSPSPSSGSGSSTSWSRAARPTTSRRRSRLAGRLDAAALGRALGEIVRRHEALRTTFAAARRASRCRSCPPAAAWRLPLRRPRGSARGPRREAEALRLAAAEAQRPFDLARGPLLRAALLRLADGRARACCSRCTTSSPTAGRWACWSASWRALYPAFAPGAPSPLPELPVQYADFALWQRELAAGRGAGGAARLLAEQLAGAPRALELPTDRPRPAVQPSRGASLSRRLSRELSERAHRRWRGARGRRSSWLLLAALRGAAVALHRPGRPGGRHADRRAARRRRSRG